MIVYESFSRIKKIIGRTETRTRYRIYCQTIRTVRDIPRDDRARIANCSLRTPTDRQRDRETDRLKDNYSIDTSSAGWCRSDQNRTIGYVRCSHHGGGSSVVKFRNDDQNITMSVLESRWPRFVHPTLSVSFDRCTIHNWSLLLSGFYASDCKKNPQ